MAGIQLCLVLGLVTATFALTPNTFLNTADFKRLEDLFEGHLTARKDLQSVHYAALGAKVIGKTVSNAQVCAVLSGWFGLIWKPSFFSAFLSLNVNCLCSNTGQTYMKLQFIITCHLVLNHSLLA